MILKNCHKTRLLDMIDGNRLVCFGAGKILRRICDELGIFDSIDFVADNNAGLHGTFFQYEGKSKPILPIGNCFGAQAGGYVIFITCGAYYEVFDQLNRMSELEETKCYIYQLLKESESSFKFEVPESQIEKIPKKIHYVWFGGGQIPEANRSCLKSWEKYCPDYEIIRWDESNYDVSRKAYIREAYESKKWAFAADHARLDIVHRHGGIYLDTDVELIRGLDSFLTLEGFAGFQHNGQVNLGSGFGAIAGNMVIESILKYYDGLCFAAADGTLNTAPSPEHETAALKRLGLVCDSNMQDICGFKIYPTEVFCPKNFDNCDIEITENTFSIHHFCVSWYDETQKAAYKEKTDKLKYLWSLMAE